MNSLGVLIGRSLLLLFLCGFPVKADTLLKMVGPLPVQSVGRLIVYSATEPGLAEAGAEFDWEENRNIHTNYTIYKDGLPYQVVHNSFGPDDEAAKFVELPPGHYTVRAMSRRNGWVLVPVLIKAGALTSVDLVGNSSPPHQSIPSKRIAHTPSEHATGMRETESSK